MAIESAADRVFTINRFMSAELQKRGVEPNKISLVPNAVSRYSEVGLTEKPTRIGLGINSRLVVGYIGSFNAYEGLEDAIESLARVIQSGLDVSLLLVGSSASHGFNSEISEECLLSRTYRNLAAKRGIVEKVKLVGRVPASDVGGYYELLDLVLIPRRPFEVCELVSPMKPLEAASYGKQVLMSNVAPLADLSKQSRLFHYFEKGSVDSLAKRMEEILRSPQAEPQKDVPVLSWRESVHPILKALKLSYSVSDLAGTSNMKRISKKTDKPEAGKAIFSVDDDWQTPAITEKHAADWVERRGGLPGEVAYLGFPWATLFDLLNKSHPRAGVLLEKLHGLASQVGESRPAAVVTVCQHVELPKHVGVVAGAGITDVFWSHATKGVRTLAEGGGVSLHPLPLYPVHVVPEVLLGAERPLLFSFAGAIENPCYLSEARLWIWEHLRDHPKGRVVGRGMWHYHSEVYEAQIQGRALGEDKEQVEKEEEFRDLLLNSVFSLCPSGSGPNSIRLWESLASGAIPVVISDGYLPPGDLCEWNEAVVFCGERREDIAALPARLERIAGDTAALRRMRTGCFRLAEKFGPENFGSVILEWAEKRGGSLLESSAGAEFGLRNLAVRLLGGGGDEGSRSARVFLACVESRLRLEGEGFRRSLEADDLLTKAVRRALELCPNEYRIRHERALMKSSAGEKQ